MPEKVHVISKNIFVLVFEKSHMGGGCGG